MLTKISSYENLTKMHFMLMKLSLNFIDDFVYPERCVLKDKYLKLAK